MATCASSAGARPSCLVCYRDYSDSSASLVPRILHCGHTYCTECLQRLLEVGVEEKNALESLLNIYMVQERETLRHRHGSMGLAGPPSPRHVVTCPVCKSSNHIQDGEVGRLTKNFALLGFQEEAEKSSRHYCSEHDHEQRVYCLDCQQLVCAYCQLYGKHKNHSCLYATEASQPAVERVRSVQGVAGAELAQVKTGEEAVVARVNQFKQKQAKCEHNIVRYFDKMIDTLQKRRDSALSQVQSWATEQTFVLCSQLQSLKETRKDCDRLQKDCSSMVEHDPLQCLLEEASLQERAGQLSRRVAGLSLQPLIFPRVSTHYAHSQDERIRLLLELAEGLRVEMELNSEEEEEKSEEEEEEGEEEGDEEVEDRESDSLATPCSSIGCRDGRGQLVYAQDTHHNTDSSRLEFTTGLPQPSSSAFRPEARPTYPSQASSPLSYGAGVFSSRSRLYPSSHHSPSSSNSEYDSGEDYKLLDLQPLSYLGSSELRHAHSTRVPLSPSQYRLSPEEAEADDEDGAGEEASLHAPCLSPPSSILIPRTSAENPFYSWASSHNSQQALRFSIAGQELHIAINSSSDWPTFSAGLRCGFEDEALSPSLRNGGFLVGTETEDQLAEDSD